MSNSHATGDRPHRVLLIEDSEFDRIWLRSYIAEEGLEVIEARDGLSGLDLCRADPPDLILLDLALPFCDGFEILRRLKEDRRTGSIPVIVVSAVSETSAKTRGLDLGAVDYITKPFDQMELRARVRVALRTKRMQDVLEQRAHVDGLTGLANRLCMEERLTTEWGLCQRHGGSLALWIADLDHFKLVNDTHGHTAGDEVLRRTAAILRSSVRSTDMTARYGGEEFVVIAPHCDLAGAFKTAERFRDHLAASPTLTPSGQAINVTISIGIASFPEDPVRSPIELIDRADKALYQAKAMGRNMVLSRINASSPGTLSSTGRGVIPETSTVR